MMTYETTKEDVEKSVTPESVRVMLGMLADSTAEVTCGALRTLYAESDYKGAAAIPKIVATIQAAEQRVTDRLRKHYDLSDLWDAKVRFNDLIQISQHVRALVVASILLQIIVDQHVLGAGELAGAKIEADGPVCAKVRFA